MLAAAMGMTESRVLVPSGTFDHISPQVFWQMVELMPLFKGLLESPSGLKTCTIMLDLFALFLRQCCLGWLLAQNVAKDDLELFWSSCLLLQSSGITGVSCTGVGIKPRALCTARQGLHQLSDVPSMTSVFKSGTELGLLGRPG